jgi:hypothetical protein
MTREDIIIKLAQKAGFYLTEKGDPLAPVFLRFAALVAEAEREACAKVCETEYEGYDWADREKDATEDCAAAIRARGSK